MTMCNLAQYSDNCSDTSSNLWQFERDELSVNDINTALTNDNVPSFNYKASNNGNTVADGVLIFEYFLEIIRNAIN